MCVLISSLPAYTPSQKITIDEGMCKFQGHVYFKQYMPQKPNKYVTLVKTLLANLSGKGYTLFTDRFYTSPILASELEAAKSALVGTTRKSRWGLPCAIKDPNLQ
ncbi:uncharacterized protein LOC124795674 [Schistocerca piceifrons]|uniref:uncharacterized protein LOC124795674 n=1 Tax=Schistocerca piceifrons TaxID=274613 RepID=UPI001F5EC59F|nr:uncharacterized protein LOC124795674 [Schistocerca piceifrons]